MPDKKLLPTPLWFLRKREKSKKCTRGLQFPNWPYFRYCSFFWLFTVQEQSPSSQEAPRGGPEYHISALKSDFEDDTLSITLVGDTIPAYTVSERFAPFRVIVDVAGASLEKPVRQAPTLIPDNPVGALSVFNLPDQQQPITRFEIAIADTHDYKVTRQGNNIAIVVAPADEISQAADALPVRQTITDFQVETRPEETSILLVGSSTITDFQVGTQKADQKQPASMFIDIPNVSITELVREKPVGTAVKAVRVEQRGNGARILFDSASAELFAYDVQAAPQGIAVRILEDLGDLPLNVRTVAAAKSDTITDATLDELIESSSSLMSKKPTGDAQPDSVSAMQDSFAFSGYKNQRISVDFYKIDIHNVFRLFRQITNLNIIVDEDVQGTLTLALSDVPWDFALDIILNLQDLEKVERFNTIVIYPKKKEFIWPERAMDNLSFEADVQVVEEESLVIEQSANVPVEVMQAKDLLRKASLAEKSNDFEDAASLYEQAATLWPTNASIYNRLATIYLVNLSNNPKAIFFAKAALKADPRNQSAALYAAIGSANMERQKEATEFFTQAISGNPPMKEALFSFASFSENTNQHATALKLLDKYQQYHGETVDTMLARARIFDKMGDTDKANQQYKALMASGFQLGSDLRDYISGRLAGTNY